MSECVCAGPLTLQNDYFSQLRKCIRFDPRRYIAGAVIAFFICLVVLIVYHKRHKKQKDKENRKIGSYGGGCNDRHDEKTIKEVLQHIHPETYGQPKDSWYETIKRNQSSAFKEDKTDYYPKET
jgi:hypothetical protein